MVTIIDPHIRRDDEYYVYKQAVAGAHLVLNKDGAVYEGWCWPGTSVKINLDFYFKVAYMVKATARTSGVMMG